MHLAPQRGAIARCSLGHLGLITSETPVEQSGTSVWKGIHLGGKCIIRTEVMNTEPKDVGTPWQSREPVVLGYAHDIIEALKLLNQARRTKTPEQMCKELADLDAGLSDYQVTFVENCMKWINQREGNRVSVKQADVIKRWWDEKF